MTMDYTLLSKEEFEQLALEMTAEQIGNEINKITHHQITLAISAIQPERDPEWLKKLQAIYQNLQNTEQLEALGEGLLKEQGLAILEMCTKMDTNHHKKLSSILVGLSHITFLEILSSASIEQLNSLQNEGLSEAVHHHLTLFIHEMTQKIERQSTILESLPSKILELDVKNLSKNNVIKIEKAINESQLAIKEITEKINKALSLAWNTNRVDIIEKISHLKEQCIRIESFQIGLPRTMRVAPTGLYLLLENHLSTVFYDAEKPDQGLQDDDPAIEALAKLSLWYLEDYWKIGLLPHITTEADLTLDLKAYTEKESMEYREALVRQIYENLQNLCLVTVEDLKAAGIYSKSMLQDYITENFDHLN